MCPFGHDLSLFCRPCSNSSYNRYQAHQHKKSKEHKELGRRLAAFCKLCSEDLKEAWATHLKTARHRDAAGRTSEWFDPPFPAYKELTEPAEGCARCVVCHVDVPQDQWEQHIGLSIHRVKWTLTVPSRRFRKRKQTAAPQGVTVSNPEGLDFGIIDAGVKNTAKDLVLIVSSRSIRIESARMTSMVEGRTGDH